MKIKEYLNNRDVKDFMQWLKPRLDGDVPFIHQYLDRRSGQSWECVSIYDAFRKYHWPFSCRFSDHHFSGSSFSENNQALSFLREQLRASFYHGDTDALLTVSCAILEWGRVTTYNVGWVQKNSRNLRSIYRKGATLLDLKTADDSIGFPFRFNSGFSKIYSLLLNDFVIYDSRVGAALGYLVVQYCQEHCLGSIPKLLQFPWRSAKEVKTARPKNRNPSIGPLIFQQISNHGEYALWNLRASWLLKEVVSDSKHFSGEDDPLRALEAALFMIGYDLGGRIKAPKVTRKTICQKESARDDYPLTTHGKGYAFRVDYSSPRSSLIFSYPLKSNGRRRSPDEFSLFDIKNVCIYLQNNFKSSAFPLANNVQLLGSMSEKPGLGMAIRTLPETVLKAQAASYLGPYLEEIGIFKLVSPRPAK